MSESDSVYVRVRTKEGDFFVMKCAPNKYGEYIFSKNKKCRIHPDNVAAIKRSAAKQFPGCDVTTHYTA